MTPARGKEEEPLEADRVAGRKHPRETYDLLGQDEALARAAQAIRTGRAPQAWLIAGSPGVGKATFAYRIARYLLRHGAGDSGPADLCVPPQDSVSRRIEAQSHPGLMVLKRREDERGRLKTVMPVEEIRRLAGFFGLTAEAGGWRVALIDSADEMNDNAANALLKILEEPPPRGMLLLVSHAPGRLLPTIRSRCRRVDLKPLDEAVLGPALARLLPETDAADRATLLRISEGSLGLALRLAGEDGLQWAREADTLLDARGAPDIGAILSLGERTARKPDGLRHFGEFLTQAVAARIRARAQEGHADARAVRLWEQAGALFGRAVGLHLEPKQTVLTAALAIAEAKRRGAL
jgi:DNA polymerase-3 subunit delta'